MLRGKTKTLAGIGLPEPSWKKYQKENPEKFRVYRKKYYRKNRDRLLLEKREYYGEHREEILERQRLGRRKNLARDLERQRLYRERHTEERLLYHALARAKRYGIPFSITKKDILVPKTCPVLGIPIFVCRGHLRDNSPTLDRIVPQRGYVPGNVVVISKRANTIKNDATPEELEAVAKWYRERIGRQEGVD